MSSIKIGNISIAMIELHMSDLVFMLFVCYLVSFDILSLGHINFWQFQPYLTSNNCMQYLSHDRVIKI